MFTQKMKKKNKGGGKKKQVRKRGREGGGREGKTGISLTQLVLALKGIWKNKQKGSREKNKTYITVLTVPQNLVWM